MHTRQLIELAAIAAAQAPLLLEPASPVSLEAGHAFHDTVVRRAIQWHRSLDQYQLDAPRANALDRGRLWRSLIPVIEGIFTGELLVRVWGGVLAAHDVVGHESRLEPFARRALVAQVDIQNRALSLLLDDSGVPMRDAAALNRLRRRTQQWVDSLLGPLVADYAVNPFAVSAERALDFAEDRPLCTNSRNVRPAWYLTVAALRSAFAGVLHESCPHPHENERIASSVLAALSPEVFDSRGQIASHWLLRL